MFLKLTLVVPDTELFRLKNVEMEKGFAVLVQIPFMCEQLITLSWNNRLQDQLI